MSKAIKIVECEEYVNGLATKVDSIEEIHAMLEQIGYELQEDLKNTEDKLTITFSLREVSQEEADNMPEWEG